MFVHDCTTCIPLGSWINPNGDPLDFYIHQRDRFTKVLARWGNNPDEYNCIDMPNHNLSSPWHLAVEYRIETLSIAHRQIFSPVLPTLQALYNNNFRAAHKWANLTLNTGYFLGPVLAEPTHSVIAHIAYGNPSMADDVLQSARLLWEGIVNGLR